MEARRDIYLPIIEVIQTVANNKQTLLNLFAKLKKVDKLKSAIKATLAALEHFESTEDMLSDEEFFTELGALGSLLKLSYLGITMGELAHLYSSFLELSAALSSVVCRKFFPLSPTTRNDVEELSCLVCELEEVVVTVAAYDREINDAIERAVKAADFM